MVRLRAVTYKCSFVCVSDSSHEMDFLRPARLRWEGQREKGITVQNRIFCWPNHIFFIPLPVVSYVMS